MSVDLTSFTVPWCKLSNTTRKIKWLRFSLILASVSWLAPELSFYEMTFLTPIFHTTWILGINYNIYRDFVSVQHLPEQVPKTHDKIRDSSYGSHFLPCLFCCLLSLPLLSPRYTLFYVIVIEPPKSWLILIVLLKALMLLITYWLPGKTNGSLTSLLL